MNLLRHSSPLVVVFTVFVLCLGVGLAMPGVEGSLLDSNDSDEDVFHASVVLGVTLASNSVQLPTRLAWQFADLESPAGFNILHDDVLFRPPVPSLLS